MQDHEIVALYWERNETAIAETEKKYGGYCYVIAYNVLYSHEDAEECVNDTYLRAWETMPPEKPSALNAYLGRIWPSTVTSTSTPTSGTAASP